MNFISSLINRQAEHMDNQDFLGETTLEDDSYQGLLDFLGNFDVEQSADTQETPTNLVESIENRETRRFESTPCQTCVAEGKTFKRRLFFVNYCEALYLCENADCKNDGSETDDIIIKIDYWKKPLVAEELEDIKLPVELLQYFPSMTRQDAKKILHIANYRIALERYDVIKTHADQHYRIQKEILGNASPELIEVDPPSKTDFSLADCSDSEVNSVIKILDTIEAAKSDREETYEAIINKFVADCRDKLELKDSITSKDESEGKSSENNCLNEKPIPSKDENEGKSSEKHCVNEKPIPSLKTVKISSKKTPCRRKKKRTEPVETMPLRESIFKWAKTL